MKHAVSVSVSASVSVSVSVLVAVAVAATTAQAQSADPTAALVEAERAFARAASVRTVNEAFLAVLTDSAVLFRPAPVNGRAALTQKPMRANLSLVWTPTYAETSSDGQLGFDGGPSEFGDRGQAPAGTGFFFSVWRKLGAGWKLETDCGISSPIPTRPDSAAHLLVMRKSDRKFSDAGALADVEKSLIANYKTRYAQLADVDVRVYRDGTTPTSSREAGLALIERDPDSEQVISKVVVAGSGDLGYVIGVVDPKGSAPKGYQRMYRRAADGSWKIAVDCRP